MDFLIQINIFLPFLTTIFIVFWPFYILILQDIDIFLFDLFPDTFYPQFAILFDIKRICLYYFIALQRENIRSFC